MIEFETRSGSRYIFSRGLFTKKAGAYRSFPGDLEWRPYVSIVGKIQAGERVIIRLNDDMAIMTTPIRQVISLGSSAREEAHEHVPSFAAWLLEQGDALSLGG